MAKGLSNKLLGRQIGAALRVGELDPLLSPRVNRLDHRLEILPFFGQAILDTYRNLGIHHALDNARALQFAQAVAQNAVGKAIHCRSHLAKTLGTLQQGIEYQARPTLAEQLNSVLVARAQRIICLLHFCWLHCLSYLALLVSGSSSSQYVSACVTIV